MVKKAPWLSTRYPVGAFPQFNGLVWWRRVRSSRARPDFWVVLLLQELGRALMDGELGLERTNAPAGRGQLGSLAGGQSGPI